MPTIVASAPAVTSSAAAPAPPKPALAIREEGGDIVCEGEGRCRFGIRAFSGELQVKTLATGATVEYGTGTTGTGKPELARVLAGIQRPPSFIGDERNDREITARIAIRVTFADGERAEGKVPLGNLTTRMLLNAGFAKIVDGPIAVPNDSPHDGKPRAMWITGGHVEKQPYGSAASLDQLDWILVVDDSLRSIKCPKGNTVTVSDTRARVYERRSGKPMGERVFPSGISTSLVCTDVAMVSMRSAEAPAQWAWNQLR